MQKTAILAYISALVLSFPAIAQNTLTWNLSVPLSEKVDSVMMKIVDLSGKNIFSDSIALKGTRKDIPTGVTISGESRFNADIYGDGNKINFKIHSNRHEDGFVRDIRYHRYGDIRCKIQYRSRRE